jgi:glycosyltransferase involved in cell wall biosynthesis
MLAARGVVHVLVVSLVNMPGPCDSCLELGATAMTDLRVALKAQPSRQVPAKRDAPTPNLPRLKCEAAGVAALLAKYAAKHGLEQLFVFRMQTLLHVQGCLDSFPIRLLDLDELPSRHHRVIAALCDEAAATVEKRAQLAALVLEKKLVPRFDRVFASSREEAEEVTRQAGAKAFVLPNIRPLATEVAPAPSPNLPSSEFLFVGTLEYLPNLDGVTWFCRDVLPILRERLGESARFRVIGFGDTAQLNAVRELPGVCLSGYQAELGPFYAQAAAAIVPLRAGTGTRLKILEAFAYGRPVVSTTVGAEGLEVIPGEHLLVADSSADFANACIALMEQPNLARRLIDSAARLCRERYSEEALGRCYDAAMTQQGTLPMDYSP